MSEVSMSSLAEVNPVTPIPRGITGRDFVSFIPMGDVSESGQWTARQERPLSSINSGFTAFKEDDVLFAKITPCMENGKGTHAVGLRNGIGFGSTEFHVLRAKSGADPRFVFHLAHWQQTRKAAEGKMVGSAGQKRVPRSFFDEFLVVNLDAKEQSRVAQILDTLDTAIQETESLIAKLKAVKQGLLHDLLTRGIDANGELRPPQSEAPGLYKMSALGWIPREWECTSFGDLCISSAFGPRFPSDAYDDNGPLATLRTTDMDEEGNISLSTMPRAAISPSAFLDHILCVGDIVISRSGTCGVTGIFGGHVLPVIPGAFLIRFRLRSLHLNRYFCRYFNSHLGRPRLDQLAVGGVQKNIKGSDVLCLKVPHPSPPEATEIADRIESVEHDISCNQQLMQKWQLQKSGLMDDLLTGRVRVTPLLPAHAEESP